MVKSKKYNLQVPVDVEVKEQVEDIVKAEGFDSLQAFTRFIYARVIKGDFKVIATGSDEFISAEAETKLTKSFDVARREYKQGKTKPIRSGQALLAA